MIPATLEWVNLACLRMDQQLGRPVLVEFWDFCRVSSHARRRRLTRAGGVSGSSA